MTHWAETFVGELRARAEQMRAYGDDRGAKMCEEHAREIEVRRAAYEDEQLSLKVAVLESGYTDTNLRRLRKIGQWSGCRRDLPRRPTSSATSPELVTPAKGIPSIADLVFQKKASDSRRRSASQ